MNFSISIDTYICLGVILSAIIICFILVLKYKNSEKLVANRRIVEYFPTFISTLGVLGTFWGITKGLLAFDTTDLDRSIPGLLDGLKTAFFTSLAGMIGSMILSAFINRKQDERDGGVSDINQAAGEITKSIKAMSEANTETIRSIQKQLADQEADRKAFYRTVGDVMRNMSDTQKAITSSIDSLIILQRSQEGTLSGIKDVNSTMLVSLNQLEEISNKQTSSIDSVVKNTSDVCEYTHHLGEILDVVSSISGIEDDMYDFHKVAHLHSR